MTFSGHEASPEDAARGQDAEKIASGLLRRLGVKFYELAPVEDQPGRVRTLYDIPCHELGIFIDIKAGRKGNRRFSVTTSLYEQQLGWKAPLLYMTEYGDACWVWDVQHHLYQDHVNYLVVDSPTTIQQILADL